MRFLRQVFGAQEVGDGNCVVGLREKAADLVGHVLLRGI